jgi:DNA-binding transcriptional LysR family regulator
MELRHLRSFKTVAELLNFSRAAERLHLTQSALSRQVSELENDIGVRLFERTHVRVRLTDAGRVLYRHSCKILTNVEIAELAAREAASGATGELVVCHDWRIFNEVALRSVAEFRVAHPGVMISLREMPQHEQVSALRERRVHVGFVTTFPGKLAHHGLETLPVLKSELVVLVGPNHRLANRKAVRLRELAGETWVCSEMSGWPSVRQLTSLVCRRNRFVPKFSPPAKTLNGALARVVAGDGICLAPHFMTMAFAPAVLRILRCDGAAVEIHAAWNPAESSTVLQQFVAVVRRNVRLDAVPAAAARR